MNGEEIIRMAQEAGIKGPLPARQGFRMFASPYRLQRFATLVAAAEREACAKVCEQIANELSAWTPAYEGLTAETKFVQKMGETIGQPFIEAIRARGQL